MPTAAKFVAALAFGLVGWLAAHFYVPLLPEGTGVGYFREIVAGLGLFLGWWSLGPAVGKSYADALSLGLKTSALVVAWSLLGFSTYYMILRSTKMMYQDAGEAVLDVPTLMLHYGKLMGSVPLLAVLVVGGVLGGWAAEFAARRWK
jgi:hypothetical protein